MRIREDLKEVCRTIYVSIPGDAFPIRFLVNMFITLLLWTNYLNV